MIGMRGELLLILVLLSLAPVVALDPASPPSLGQWASTTSYPLKVAGESCDVYSNTVYCIGGFDAQGKDYDNAYYASLSSSGIGPWTSTTPYPADIDSQSCAIASAEIYCVGGENSTSVVSNVYEAPITSSGIGAWSQAAAYPQTIAASSCFVSSGYLYCVGGFDITGDETAASYYSSLSSGLKSWMSSTAYPFAVNSEACMVQGNSVYCVAGNEESGLPQFPVANVYYAQISASGIGTWTSTAQYPNALSTVACVLNSGDIYCAGGFNLDQLSSDHVYFTAIGGSGLASWTNGTAYPVPFDVSSCVTDLSHMYCVAGRSFTGKLVTMSNADYYAALGGSSSTNATSSTSSTASSSTVTSSSSSSSAASTASSTSSTTTTQASSTTSSTATTTSVTSASGGNSTTSTPTTTTSTAPEFDSNALILTTLVVLSAVVLLFRIRGGRNVPGLRT
jgi:hypothetical protein